MEIKEALRQSRSIGGRSQEYMALELGVARKTVQNWEKGVSEPTIGQAIKWFDVLKISPLPYLFHVVNPDLSDLSSDSSVDELRTALERLIEGLPEEGVRQLLYLFYGEHGSAPRGVMNMVTAHLQTPMHDRVTNSKVILQSYNMASRKKQLTSPDNVQPNINLLLKAISLGEDAAVSGSTAYLLGDTENY